MAREVRSRSLRIHDVCSAGSVVVLSFLVVVSDLSGCTDSTTSKDKTDWNEVWQDLLLT